MSEIKLEVRRYRVPIGRTTKPNEEGEMVKLVSYQEVDLKDYYKDSEEITIEGIESLNDEGIKVNAYNSRQLSFAQKDDTIVSIYKKVICKPKTAESKH
jgi:hypothetical protein